jgi:HSP20 family protein
MANILTRTEPRTDLMRGPLGRWIDRDLRWMRQLTRDMDRIFGDFGRPYTFEREETGWIPEMEVFERNGRLIIRTDLPGMKKDDVKVNVQDNVLTIEGERKVEEETKKDNFHRTERMYGTFFRSLTLPDGLKLDHIDAKFKDGVLELDIPMEEAKKTAKNVEVKIV